MRVSNAVVARSSKRAGWGGGGGGTEEQYEETVGAECRDEVCEECLEE